MDANTSVVITRVSNGFIVHIGFPEPGCYAREDDQYVFESIKNLETFLEDHFYSTSHDDLSKLKKA